MKIGGKGIDSYLLSFVNWVLSLWERRNCCEVETFERVFSLSFVLFCWNQSRNTIFLFFSLFSVPGCEQSHWCMARFWIWWLITVAMRQLQFQQIELF